MQIFKSILPLAALLALAVPIRADVGSRLLVIGERIERLPDRAETAFRAQLDLRGLDSAERIVLELPGRLASVERSRIEHRAGGDLLWTGRTRLGEEVVLTLRGGRLAGTVFGRERGYRIYPSGEGGHTLLEVAAGEELDCGGAPLHGPSAEGAELRARIAASSGSSAEHRTPRIDLLVVYADASREILGSKRDLLTLVDHFVDLTNVAFHNSEMDIRVRLAHAAEVTVPENIVGDDPATLNWLVESSAIADLRDARGADVVGLVYEGGNRICGSAAMIYRPGGPTLSRAFFVSQRACGGETFAHEVGHLLGADHNPEDARAEGRYIYGRAHYHSGGYRTLMSYTSGCSDFCPTQPFFSNPRVRYERRPTGIRNERDNARIIDEFSGEVERFSPTLDDPVCDLEPGDADFCLECGPCRAGEGGCEADSECDAGLACDPNGGADFGFGAKVGVCRAAGGCDLEPGDPDYCRLCGPCGFGAGDCDLDRECQAGLICLDDIGETFGLPPAADVCAFRENGYCPLPLGHPDYCEACGPCLAGEGSCKGNLECAGFLTCFSDVGGELGFSRGTGVCLQAPPERCPFQPGSPEYCKLCGLCEAGEGDCDGDRECRGDLTCADGAGAAFGFDESIDVCLESLRAPKRLKARALSSARVRLKWKDKSKNEAGFHVEMRVAGGPFERIASTGPNTRKLVVGDLASGATYTFRAQAFNADAASPYSNERTVTLP